MDKISEEKAAIDYDSKMVEALTLIGDSGAVEDIIKAAAIFKEVHDYVQDVPLFKKSKEPYSLCRNEMIAEYPDVAERIEKSMEIFLAKVCAAPTSIHRTACVILQIPMIYEFIQEYLKLPTDREIVNP